MAKRSQTVGKPLSCATIDQKSQSIYPDGIKPVLGYDRVRIGETGTYILRLQIGKIFKNRLRGLALRQQAQDHFHGNPHSPDNRLAAEYLRVDGNSFEETIVLHH